MNDIYQEIYFKLQFNTFTIRPFHKLFIDCNKR